MSTTPRFLHPSLLLAPLLLAVSTAAQVLTSGNSQLPACAQSCQLLNQASQACGGTQSVSQGIWSCFCQSGYLTSLYNSPAGICDGSCPDPAQNQQVMTWYQNECGSDNGASEHSGNGNSGNGNGNGGQTTVQTSTSTQSTSAAAGTSTSSSSSGDSSSSSSSQSSSSSSSSGSWWDTHYKWIIMLIVIFIGLLVIALLAVWFKRRHDRKQDLPNASFNEGITSRPAPSMATMNNGNSPYPPQSRAQAPSASASGVLEPVGAGGSGKNSPARTREAFMPYGYGYSHSEPRLENRGNEDAIEAVGRGSPLARGGTPVGELEKNGGEESGKKSGKRRVLVRERSMGQGSGRGEG